MSLLFISVFSFIIAFAADNKAICLNFNELALCEKEQIRENIQLMQEKIKKDPTNPKYIFCLAESYLMVEEIGKALEWFQKRIKVKGSDEELFYSKLQIGHLLRKLALPDNLVLEAYKNAYLFRPHRAEGTYFIAEMFNKLGLYQKAYDVLKVRQFILKPTKKDEFFNEEWVIDYGLAFQLSISAYYVGQYQESLDISDYLLERNDLPEEWRKQVLINREFPLAKLQMLEEQDRSLRLQNCKVEKR